MLKAIRLCWNQITGAGGLVTLLAMTTTSATLAKAPEAQPPQPPNIILIMADDFGYECLGSNGGGPYRTPVLDQLAKEGIRFTQCHALPLCTPSRVQIMTGRYGFRNYRGFGKFDLKERTFGNFLREAGYATCISGKWQLRGGFEAPGIVGFDQYCLRHLTLGKKTNDKYPRFRNPLYEIDGEIVEKPDTYSPDVFCEFLLDFITRNRDKPFFCYYPMALTHEPFEPTPETVDPSVRDKMRNFVDMVAYTDNIVGRIIAHLETLNLRENTVILFTGDNGTHRSITASTLDGRPWPGGKGYTAETGTRVPLIASWPAAGRGGGRVLDDLVDFSDFVPTVAELAGATLPAAIKFDGHSFAAQLRGEKHEPRQWIYSWYKGKGYVHDKYGTRDPLEWARDKRFTLFKSGEFYDSAADPFHVNALSERERDGPAAAAHKALQAVLDGMQKEQR
jgi:arylsulfatase A